MTVTNLTPHEVRVITEDADDVVYPASGNVARLQTFIVGTDNYTAGVEVPVRLVAYGELAVLPEQRDGFWYIVSLPCALANGRKDLLFPFDEVRDENGRIIGCRSLGRRV
jgi:hypothetical protein